MLRMLEPYLIEKDLSKPGQPLPGEHMYQVSIIKFMLCVGKYTNLLRKINNGQSKAFEIYSRLLITPEAEVQSIAWNTVSEVLTREQESKQRQFLNNYAIHVAGNFVDLHERNPDVQDALFDFLYKCLTNAEKWFAADASDKNRDICTLVLRKMHSHHASYVYCQRINYLRLLGKCMAILVNEFMVRSVFTFLFYFICRKIFMRYILAYVLRMTSSKWNIKRMCTKKSATMSGLVRCVATSDRRFSIYSMTFSIYLTLISGNTVCLNG